VIFRCTSKLWTFSARRCEAIFKRP